MSIQDLDPGLRARIDDIFFRARSLFRDGLVEPAIMEAEQAWQALPEPKFGWDVTLSYTHMLARLYRDAGMYQQAEDLIRQLFSNAEILPYQDEPYLVLGTIYFRWGRMADAHGAFDKAARISKNRCFRKEDAVYLDFYKSYKA